MPARVHTNMPGRPAVAVHVDHQRKALEFVQAHLPAPAARTGLPHQLRQALALVLAQAVYVRVVLAKVEQVRGLDDLRKQRAKYQHACSARPWCCCSCTGCPRGTGLGCGQMCQPSMSKRRSKVVQNRPRAQVACRGVACRCLLRGGGEGKVGKGPPPELPELSEVQICARGRAQHTANSALLHLIS